MLKLILFIFKANGLSWETDNSTITFSWFDSPNVTKIQRDKPLIQLVSVSAIKWGIGESADKKQARKASGLSVSGNWAN